MTSDRHGSDTKTDTAPCVPPTRLLWVLYSDARSLLNTLLAEFKHIRITAYAHMKHAAPDVLTYPPQSRGVRQYEQFGIREKQYLAIADTAAQQLNFLLNVREELSDAFKKAAEERQLTREEDFGANGSLYWFIAKRAYVVEVLVADATDVLSHLHDKIAQMLDTTSGYMPQPLLLRRWQSASHEKFLSAYCRDLCVDTAKLMAFLNIPDFEPETSDGAERLEFMKRSTKRWKQTVVSHVWIHRQTSETIRLDGQAPTGEERGPTTAPIAYALVRSLFFYLEHPILFPLLFHELTHIQMDLDQKEKDAEERYGHAGQMGFERFAFLKSSERAAADLKYGTAEQGIDISDGDFRALTAEIWADAIGVTLGGASFLQALALQILGQQERQNICGMSTAFNNCIDTEVESRSWCKQVRILDEKTISSDAIRYFAFARLLVAVRVSQALYDRGSSERWVKGLPFADGLQSACDAIEDLWNLLKQSGAYVYRSSRSSGTHDDSWRFYCNMNDWVAKSCFVHLASQIDRMWRYAADHWRHAYRLGTCSPDRFLRKRIWQFFDVFLKHTEESRIPKAFSERFKNFRPPASLTRSAPARLEDAALAIRWAVATLLYPSAKGEVLDQGALDDLIDNTRWDGLGAFRYLLEWYQLLMARGHNLSEQPWPETGEKLRDLAADLQSLFSANFSDEKEADRELKSLMSKFMIFFLNPRYEWWARVGQPADAIGDFGTLKWIEGDSNVRRQFEKSAIAFVHKLKRNLWVEGFSAIGAEKPYVLPASMFCLGVLRPSWAIGAEGLTELSALDALKELPPNNNHRVFPVIGDYSYVRWMPIRTVSNMDSFSRRELLPQDKPLSIPRHFEKPRMLIKVFGKDLLETTAKRLGDRLFIRLALVKFKFRSQWVELLKQLVELDENLKGSEEAIAEKCGMYLSSGWEDVVFMVCHNDLKELRCVDGSVYGRLNRLLWTEAENLDVQSMLITAMPDLIDFGTNRSGSGRAPDDPAPTDLTDLQSIIHAHALECARRKKYDPPTLQGEVTFGRYDARFKWTNLTPQQFQEMFLNLPGQYFHKLQHVSHGVGWSIDTPHEETPALFTRVDLTIH